MGARGPKPGTVKKTGGRQKGSKNKATIVREQGQAQILERAKAEGITPLEVMLQTMRAMWAADNKGGACLVAKDAAPYCHQRLAATELSGNENKPLIIVTGVPRTQEEYEILVASRENAERPPKPN